MHVQMGVAFMFARPPACAIGIKQTTSEIICDILLHTIHLNGKRCKVIKHETPHWRQQRVNQ